MSTGPEIEDLLGRPVRCPRCDAGTGRQNPEYETCHGQPIATGWFGCEVCQCRYVASYGRLWVPAKGVAVRYLDRGQHVTGVIQRVTGQQLVIRETGPDGEIITGQLPHLRFATVCEPAGEA